MLIDEQMFDNASVTIAVGRERSPLQKEAKVDSAHKSHASSRPGFFPLGMSEWIELG
jgi:hypothetical protein